MSVMNDTTPEAGRLARELWLALPPEQRLLMAAGMFDTARAFVMASLPDGLTLDEQRTRLCARLYGEELARRYRAALGGGGGSEGA